MPVKRVIDSAALHSINPLLLSLSLTSDTYVHTYVCILHILNCFAYHTACHSHCLLTALLRRGLYYVLPFFAYRLFSSLLCVRSSQLNQIAVTGMSCHQPLAYSPAPPHRQRCQRPLAPSNNRLSKLSITANRFPLTAVVFHIFSNKLKLALKLLRAEREKESRERA